MATGQRKKTKIGCLATVSTGIGYLLMGTIALPIVVIGGLFELGAKGIGKLIGPPGRGRRNSTFRPMRKGVRIYPM